MGATEKSEELPKFWFRYFVAPSEYAKKATAISRNILNLGLASLIVALLGYGPHVSQYDFAFRDLSSDYFASLSTQSGDYKFITGGKSSTPRGCVVESATEKELACSSEPLFSHAMDADATATAWIDPQFGVVRITLNDLEVLAPKAIQSRLRNGILAFWGLICVFFVCLAIAIRRQKSLVSAHRKANR